MTDLFTRQKSNTSAGAGPHIYGYLNQMRKSLICAALLAATPLAASAEGISYYDYAEIGYTQHTVDFKDIRGEDKPKFKGGYARGSYNVTEKIKRHPGPWRHNHLQVQRRRLPGPLQGSPERDRRRFPHSDQ